MLCLPQCKQQQLLGRKAKVSPPSLTLFLSGKLMVAARNKVQREYVKFLSKI